MKTNRILVALLALVLVPGAQAGAGLKITIRLMNSAKVANGTLAEGEKQAGRALAQAGIEVVWLDCSAGVVGPCAPDLGAGEFWFHVANWKPSASTVDGLGFTLLDRETGASLAGVYYPMVKDAARNYMIEEAPILGAAIAHEIGHLLGEGHSPTGVMCARFNRQRFMEMSQGGVLFAPNQAARIRAEVTRRSAK